MFKKLLITALTSFTLVLTGCTNEETSKEEVKEEQVAEDTTLTITDFADREITFETTPERIVSLSNAELDIFNALGVELAGRPTTKDEAINEKYSHIPSVGTTHSFDLEVIASIEPDLIIANNPLNLGDVEALEATGAKVLLTSGDSLEQIKEQISLYGQIVQKEEKAEEVIANIDSTIDEVVENIDGEGSRVLLVYGAPGTYMAALPNSLAGNILELSGGVNIAKDYPALENFANYAALDLEKIITSNPEYVLLMTHANADVVKEGFLTEMEQNPAWNSLDAVKNGNIEVLPADLFGTNPGTKIVDSIVYLDGIINQ